MRTHCYDQVEKLLIDFILNHKAVTSMENAFAACLSPGLTLEPLNS